MSFRYILLFLIFLPQIVEAQYSRKEARKQFEYGNYTLAVKLFNNDPRILEDKRAITYRGIANYHINELDQAFADLSKANELGNKDSELLYYIAKIFHHKDNYGKAIEFYRAYYKKLKKKSPYRNLIVEEIKNCAYALKNQSLDPNGFIVNFGEHVNTLKNEIYPLVSPNFPSKIYYSSDYVNDYDLYLAELSSNTWIRNLDFESIVNSAVNDLAHAISPEGEVMFFERTGQLNGKLYYNFSDSKIEPRLMPENFREVDVDFFFPNNHTVVFSSIREEGYGGFDLYISHYINKKWSSAENLGPEINSPFDERSPFMNPNEDVVFFSSNRNLSFGGFDVYKSIKSNTWMKPGNLGSPINSVGDDLFFKVGNSGLMAVMSSDRKSGYGGYDLYQVFLKDPVDMLRPDENELSFIKRPFQSKLKDQDEVVVEEKEPVVQPDREIIVAPIPEPEEEPVIEEPIDEKEIITEVPVKEETIEKEHTSDTPEPIVEIQENEGENTIPVELEPEPVLKTKPIASNEEEAPEESAPVISPVEIVKDVVLDHESLYFDDPDNMLSSDNEFKLAKVIEVLNEYPSLLVILTGHVHNRGLMEYQLFRSIKYVEKIESHLAMNDIDPSRIIVKSVASNYPYVKSNAEAKYIPFNQKVLVSYAGMNGLNQEQNLPEIPSYERDNKFEIYHTIVDELYYRVEITRQSQLFKNYLLRNYTDLLIEKSGQGDDLVYYIGLYPNYEEAKQLQQDLSKTNLPYSKVVAFHNGISLDYESAMTLVTDYPDLEEFLEAREEE